MNEALDQNDRCLKCGKTMSAPLSHKCPPIGQRFKKKPVVIEAVRWDESEETLNRLVAAGLRWVGHEGHRDRPGWVGKLRIRTLESSDSGAHYVDPGDFIIKGVKGEFYACKPDIFWRTYDPA